MTETKLYISDGSVARFQKPAVVYAVMGLKLTAVAVMNLINSTTVAAVVKKCSVVAMCIVQSIAKPISHYANFKI